jgi:hypothetical protein
LIRFSQTDNAAIIGMINNNYAKKPVFDIAQSDHTQLFIFIPDIKPSNCRIPLNQGRIGQRYTMLEKIGGIFFVVKNEIHDLIVCTIIWLVKCLEVNPQGDNRHTLRYYFDMNPFRWNHNKNEQFKIERSISFEEIVLAIEADGCLDQLIHPNPEKYPNQSVLVVAFNGYVYLAPYVEETEYFFLKTVIPSRKATRNYLLRNNPDDKT